MSRQCFQSPFSGDFLCFGKGGCVVPSNTSSQTFQSPFSGDFLCFVQRAWNDRQLGRKLSISIFRRFSLFHGICSAAIALRHYFQSPFSGDFLCFGCRGFMRGICPDFQSPFSGDFLCFLPPDWQHTNFMSAFNLHFQEIFFVSSGFQSCSRTGQ